MLLVLASLGFAAVSVSPALATSPHFIGTPTATVSGNSLVINFKAAGLGNVGTAVWNLDGTVTVSSRCYTKSGNKPQAANKQESIPVDQTTTTAVNNGQTTGGFTVTPLSTLACPGGQHVVIESVSYDLTLSGEGLSIEFKSP
jgi:hypothetical protein